MYYNSVYRSEIIKAVVERLSDAYKIFSEWYTKNPVEVSIVRWNVKIWYFKHFSNIIYRLKLLPLKTFDPIFWIRTAMRDFIYFYFIKVPGRKSPVSQDDFVFPLTLVISPNFSGTDPMPVLPTPRP